MSKIVKSKLFHFGECAGISFLIGSIKKEILTEGVILYSHFVSFLQSEKCIRFPLIEFFL